MATSSSPPHTPIKQLGDVTECPICQQIFTDPRILPCIHTYCLKCIAEWGKDKHSGDSLACPLCRKDFTIPAEGFQALPGNFFMEKLLDIQKLCSVAEQKDRLCDVCGKGNDSSEQAKPPVVAVAYCVDCQQNMCQQCNTWHRKLNMSATHQSLELGREIQVEDVTKLGKFRAAPCDKHPGKEIEVFCLQCNVAVCMLCYVKSHNKHECSDVDEVAHDFRNRIQTNIGKVAERISCVADRIPEAEKEKLEFEEEVQKIATEICDMADKQKERIERDKKSLLVELEEIRKKRIKEMETTKHELQLNMVALESFKKYCEEMKNKGTACDVARASGGLDERCSELLGSDVIKQTTLKPLTVSFSATNWLTTQSHSVVGTVASISKELAADTTACISVSEYWSNEISVESVLEPIESNNPDAAATNSDNLVDRRPQIFMSAPQRPTECELVTDHQFQGESIPMSLSLTTWSASPDWPTVGLYDFPMPCPAPRWHSSTTTSPTSSTGGGSSEISVPSGYPTEIVAAEPDCSPSATGMQGWFKRQRTIRPAVSAMPNMFSDMRANASDNANQARDYGLGYKKR